MLQTVSKSYDRQFEINAYLGRVGTKFRDSIL